MLHRAAGLTPQDLDAIACLERRLVAADGGRLKLEHATLRARSGEQVEDLLWWEDGELRGFCGIYAFGGDVEVAGMVDPSARRRGVGARLLGAALALCAERGHDTVLVVAARTGAGGEELARSLGGALDHSEHALELTTDPVGPAGALSAHAVRRAGRADAQVLLELLAAGFGEHPVAPGGLDRFDDDSETTLLVEREGRAVATLRVQRDGGRAGIYGFVVAPDLRGRGIGRSVLAQVCAELRRDGVALVHLEVETVNERALGLYTSLGFERVATEDYLRVSLR